MADLYPWPFDPAYLGDRGVVVGDVPLAEMELGPHTLPHDVATRLLEAGRRVARAVLEVSRRPWR